MPKNETENVVLRKHHGPQACKKVRKNELIIVETEPNAARNILTTDRQRRSIKSDEIENCDSRVCSGVPRYI